ncbi:hypothetical protein CTAYLR_005313 [Chrysophaeum taylorii]|uniref:Uncharacterized protein n=1 Tax=Chrysophaeum taylorii TaxID=2483200 RepID=A0AAD7UJ88_9STRA|nr:hypothetical protein CTAYLR_005313 [Chrysophaeum taylorii]
MLRGNSHPTLSVATSKTDNKDAKTDDDGQETASASSDDPKIAIDAMEEEAKEELANLEISVEDELANNKPTSFMVDNERLSPRVGILRAGYDPFGSDPRVSRSPTHRGRGVSIDDREGPFSLWAFVAVEAFGERHSTGLDDSVPQAIDNFLAVPARFERFMALGLLVSLDTFLDAVTFLPLRALVAAVALVFRGARRLSAWRARRGASPPRRPQGTTTTATAKKGSSRLRRWLNAAWVAVVTSKGPSFNRARAYDLMRFTTVLLCNEALKLVPMSRTYHWIRGQNTIKLYVIVGIMEVFDRLACAFGQDALDSFYLTTRRCETANDAKRVLLFLIVVNGVVLLHAGLLYVHITTLNVVVNASEDSAIVALLVSNNFSEIKSFVFKKYNKQNLLEVACADVCERFKLVLFLSLLALLAWSQVAGAADPRRADGLHTVVTQAVVVLSFELVADWLKHAFMAKFNKLDAKVYDEYADRLARDVVTGRGGGLALDHTHAVTRRLGLAVLPLACVAARYLTIAAGWLRISLQLSSIATILVVAAFAVCIFELKMLTSICLAGVSVGLHRDYELAKTRDREDARSDAPPSSSRTSRMSFDDQRLIHAKVGSRAPSPDTPCPRSVTTVLDVASAMRRSPSSSSSLCETAAPSSKKPDDTTRNPPPATLPESAPPHISSKPTDKGATCRQAAIVSRDDSRGESSSSRPVRKRK